MKENCISCDGILDAFTHSCKQVCLSCTDNILTANLIMDLSTYSEERLSICLLDSSEIVRRWTKKEMKKRKLI